MERVGQDSIQGLWREQSPADTLIWACDLQNCCLKTPGLWSLCGPRTDTWSVSTGYSVDASGWLKGHLPCRVGRGHSGWKWGSGLTGRMVGRSGETDGDNVGSGLTCGKIGQGAGYRVISVSLLPLHEHLLSSWTWGTDKGPSSRAQVDKVADPSGVVGPPGVTRSFPGC